MTLKKGDIIRETTRNDREGFENTAANSELIYQVVRINPKTYGLKCIGGYLEGTGCNLRKDAPDTTIDIWGTIRTRELITV